MSPPFPPAPHVPMPPVKPPARRMGIRLGGCERPLEDLIRQHVSLLPAERPYTLIEIGSAGCVTLRAFADILREAHLATWRAIGFDLPPGKAWSLDMDEVRRSFAPAEPFIMDAAGVTMIEGVNGMSLALLDDPRSYLRHSFPHFIDFAFVDGCHGACAGRDFEAIEEKVAPGGLVVFHDYGELEQGTDIQPHCREFINVRSYVHRLGLATPTPSGTTRKGWRFVGEIKGSRHWGGDGNSCAVVQRLDTPLAHQPELSIDP